MTTIFLWSRRHQFYRDMLPPPVSVPVTDYDEWVAPGKNHFLWKWKPNSRHGARKPRRKDRFARRLDKEFAWLPS